jgi:hypothetical protein
MARPEVFVLGTPTHQFSGSPIGCIGIVNLLVLHLDCISCSCTRSIWVMRYVAADSEPFAPLPVSSSLSATLKRTDAPRCGCSSNSYLARAHLHRLIAASQFAPQILGVAASCTSGRSRGVRSCTHHSGSLWGPAALAVESAGSPPFIPLLSAHLPQFSPPFRKDTVFKPYKVAMGAVIRIRNTPREASPDRVGVVNVRANDREWKIRQIIVSRRGVRTEGLRH